MYETLRIVEKVKPKYVIWENVKNLLSKKHKHNFDAYIDAMDELGYYSTYKVLNAKNYGIPQNRERVFTISIRNDIDKEFIFPEPIPLEVRLKDVLESEVDEKYYLSEAQVEKMTTTNFNQNEHIKIKTANSKGFDIAAHGDGIDLAYPNSKTRRGRVGHGVAKTLETQGNMGVLDGMRIRKLTPKECWRLMGFDDSDLEKAEKVNSNAQLYKQAGNSIVVDVLEAILWNLIF